MHTEYCSEATCSGVVLPTLATPWLDDPPEHAAARSTKASVAATMAVNRTATRERAGLQILTEALYTAASNKAITDVSRNIASNAGSSDRSAALRQDAVWPAHLGRIPKSAAA
jgi:hypothetical protein